MGKNNMVVPCNKALIIGRQFGIDHFKEFPYIHAEMDAISRVYNQYDFSGKETLVIVRLNSKFELRMAKPCESCSEVIRAVGITKIWYTNNERFVNDF